MIVALEQPHSVFPMTAKAGPSPTAILHPTTVQLSLVDACSMRNRRRRSVGRSTSTDPDDQAQHKERRPPHDSRTPSAPVPPRPLLTADEEKKKKRSSCSSGRPWLAPARFTPERPRVLHHARFHPPTLEESGADCLRAARCDRSGDRRVAPRLAAKQMRTRQRPSCHLAAQATRSDVHGALAGAGLPANSHATLPRRAVPAAAPGSRRSQERRESSSAATTAVVAALSLPRISGIVPFRRGRASCKSCRVTRSWRRTTPTHRATLRAVPRGRCRLVRGLESSAARLRTSWVQRPPHTQRRAALQLATHLLLLPLLAGS